MNRINMVLRKTDKNLFRDLHLSATSSTMYTWKPKVIWGRVYSDWTRQGQIDGGASGVNAPID